MRTRMSRLALAVGSAALSLAMIGAVGAVAAAPAGAAIGASLGGAGSDTTYWMMAAIGARYNATPKSSFGDVTTEIPPVNSAPFPASVTVPGDLIAPAMTWDSSSPAATPPNGSSAGITALSNDTTGEIDWARSSRGPNPGETNTKQFWAFVLGAVDAVKFPGSNQPAKLTQQDLIGIYTCSASTHKPAITNWKQIGGKSGAIVRYAPQAGSGTLSFFQTKLLGGHTVDQNCTTNLAIRLEEHDARGVTTKSKKNAIYMFDWARWSAQRNHFEADLRNGSSLAAFGVTAKTAVIPSAKNVNETKKRFYGTRYVYNVLSKANHPASFTSQLSSLERFVGVNPTASGGAGYICSGKAFATIKRAGFVPLAKFPTGGVGLPSSECRLNPKPL